MGKEIERKFLVADEAWRGQVTSSTAIHQGYMSRTGECTVRVRTRDEHGFLTIKGPTKGFSRDEFEYEIPVEDAAAMLSQFCVDASLEKTRYLVPYKGHVWEVDVFAGANAGLILAEIELEDPDEEFELPTWLGEEVSGDMRYFNSNLTRTPFTAWG